MGMRITSKIWDTMLMAPILDENRMRYSLNIVGQDYLGEKKSKVFSFMTLLDCSTCGSLTEVYFPKEKEKDDNTKSPIPTTE
jgi:hypothetical protein